MTILKSTGDPDVDKVHQKMVDMMLSIIKHTENGVGISFLKQKLLDLYAVAEKHFKEEENLMQDIDYPFRPTHIMAHEDILSKIRTFLEILEHSKKDYNLLINTLLKIIEKHVEHYDIALFTFNAQYWEMQK
jgi:hemerythrin-like metal-binding protein